MAIPIPPDWKPKVGLKPLGTGAAMDPTTGVAELKAGMVGPGIGAGRAALAKDRLSIAVILLKRLLVRSLVCNRNR